MMVDDQGVAGAVERLGKSSRLFGRNEVRHLRNILRASETVLELGQGQYENKHGLQGDPSGSSTAPLHGPEALTHQAPLTPCRCGTPTNVPGQYS